MSRTTILVRTTMSTPSLCCVCCVYWTGCLNSGDSVSPRNHGTGVVVPLYFQVGIR